jgi:putative Mg2+ transporter-C (MgtC) family protein
MEHVTWSTVFSFFNTQILLAAFLGAMIGVERELAGKDPSIRTFALISMGSCIFTLLSVDVLVDFHVGDPGRIAAQIVPGIGFLGAGTIFRSKYGVSGFTTAALMWVTAGIGMAVGFKRADLAISATITAIIITLSLRLLHRVIRPLRMNRKPEPTSDS